LNFSNTVELYILKIKMEIDMIMATEIESDGSSGSEQLSNSNASVDPQSFADPSLPDFCINHDFCEILEASTITLATNDEQKHIGYLERLSSCKHLVYSCSAHHNRIQSTSLAQIVRAQSEKGADDQFLQYEILGIARQLAAAVLQFHTTPWLESSWRSKDIVCFANTNQSSSSLTTPHLNVQIRTPHTPQPQPSTHSYQRPSLVQNPYLFSLGLILLELAFQKPLSSLRVESLGFTDGDETTDTDFFTADRVSKSLGSRLGVGYAKMVRKCLRCDFGEGVTDLGDQRMQDIFYRDVVEELEKLETGFRSLQTG
jgi:hypothetical protein